MESVQAAQYVKGDEVTAVVAGPDDEGHRKEHRFRIVDDPFTFWTSNIFMYYCQRLNDYGLIVQSDQLWLIPETFITGLVGPKSKITPMNTEGLL